MKTTSIIERAKTYYEKGEDNNLLDIFWDIDNDLDKYDDEILIKLDIIKLFYLAYKASKQETINPNSFGVTSGALCVKYYNEFDNALCAKCPVRKRTKQSVCLSTPFQTLGLYLRHDKRNFTAIRNYSLQEAAFLYSLLWDLKK